MRAPSPRRQASTDGVVMRAIAKDSNPLEPSPTIRAQGSVGSELIVTAEKITESTELSPPHALYIAVGANRRAYRITNHAIHSGNVNARFCFQSSGSGWVTGNKGGPVRDVDNAPPDEGRLHQSGD